MADPNTRQGKRTPVTLKIKFKSETLEQFIERYAVDVSQGGIFIRTKEPLAVGTQMKFEFQLRDASPLIAGEGTVVWTRENDPSRPAIAPGMGVRFDRLADGSQNVLERILAEKAKQAPQQRGANDSPTKPPLFTDTPTRVAPAPVQEALGVSSRRSRQDSEQTPLPPPRPFHSDADDFDEKAFEEATKVRSLDELAAQSAGLGGDVSDDAATNSVVKMPPDELAQRRQSARPDALDEPVAPPLSSAVPTPAVDRESAPELPEPPEPARAKHVSDPPATARSKAGDDSPSKTKPGVAPAPASPRVSGSLPRVVPETPRPGAESRSSAAPIVILLLVLLAGIGGAVWWFVLRDKAVEQVATTQPEGSGSQVVATTNPEGSAGSAGSADTAGSAGSAVAEITHDGSRSAGSAATTGSAGSAAVETPAATQVDTVIAATLSKGAMVEVLGTDQKGPAPLTAKLEKDKAYKVVVTAPGYLKKEIEVKGGQDKATAKLTPKPHLIMVTTDPAGADIYVDGVNTQKMSPAEVQLTTAQATRSRVRISLRRPGFKQFDQTVEASSFRDGDYQQTTSLNAKLTVQQKPENTGSAATPTGTGAGSDSATPPSGGGTGTPPPAGGETEPAPPATPPPPTPAPAPAAGSAAPSASNGQPPNGT